MKVRLGFVSNSSSSSFVAFGICIEIEDLQKVLCKKLGLKISDDNDYDPYEQLEEVLKGTDFSWTCDDNGNWYIGLNPSEIGDDETGKQFKERAQKILDDIGFKEKASWIDEVIYG